jgi:hypothetical protein
MESFLDEFRQLWVQDMIHNKLICKRYGSGDLRERGRICS